MKFHVHFRIDDDDYDGQCQWLGYFTVSDKINVALLLAHIRITFLDFWLTFSTVQIIYLTSIQSSKCSSNLYKNQHFKSKMSFKWTLCYWLWLGIVQNSKEIGFYRFTHHIFHSISWIFVWKLCWTDTKNPSFRWFEIHIKHLNINLER